MKNFVEAAEKDGVTPEMAKDFRDYSEARAAGEYPEVSAGFKHKYDAWAGTLQEEITSITKRMNPEEAAAIQAEFSNRIALKRSMLSDTLKNDTPGQISGQGAGFAKRPTSEKHRTVFALTDGTIVTTKRVDGKYQITAWRDGEPTVLGSVEARPRIGDEFNGQFFKNAQQKHIEEHTPIRYIENDLGVKGMLLTSLRKAERDRALIDKIKNSDEAPSYMTKADNPNAPEEFRQLSPEASAAIPSLRDSVFTPEMAEVIEDFAGRYRDGTAIDAANNLIIRAMMINPYPHFMNELVHWFDARGASGFLSPGQVTSASLGVKGLGLVPESVKSVLTQDSFQMDLLREGGFLLAPTVKAQIALKQAMQLGLKDVMKDAVMQKSLKAIAEASGTTVGRLVMKASDFSANVMWSTRDMMYTHLIKEQMAQGKTMREAIDSVGKHMPEYFIPSRVLKSRNLSLAMQSKLFVFGRYHYGWLRAWGENAKELTQLGKDNAAFAQGVDHALGTALGGLLVYKGLDAMYSAVFGQQAEARRAGAYHAPTVLLEMAHGERDYVSALSSIFTLNPALGIVTDIARNRDWRGKQIIPKGSTIGQSTFLAAHYGLGQLSPVQGIQRGVEGKGSIKKTLAGITDVKLVDPMAKYRGAAYDASAIEKTKALEAKYGIK